MPLTRERVILPVPHACVVEAHGDAVHVIPSGELDISTVPRLESRLVELHDAGARRIVLDLAQLTFMDVQGLRLILRWSDAARLDGAGAFEVIPGPPHIQRVFGLTATGTAVAFVDGNRAG